MTSSCFDHFALGPRRGPLPEWSIIWTSWTSMASKNQSLAWECHFWTTWHWAPRSGCVARLESSIFAQKTAFLESKRSLSSVFWPFFDLGRARPHAKLARASKKLGRTQIWSPGKYAMSSNRHAFQAQLAPRRPKLTPRRPQKTPRRV